MSLRNPLLPFLLVGAALTPLSAKTPEGSAEEVTRKANAIIAEFMSSTEANAVSALITIGEEPVFEGGAGAPKPGSHETADVDSLLSAESMAHTFLVTAALQLESQEKLDTNDLVATHVSNLVPKDCPVRIAELMAHTSGLADYRDFTSAEILSSGQPTYLALATTVLEVEPETAPKECVAESATNTMLLAALLEQVTGQTADELLQVAIFDKLGMQDTEYGLAIAVREASAAEEPEPARAFLPKGLTSSANDLGKFHRGLLGKKLVDSDTLERMETQTRLADGSSSNYALGMRHVELHGAGGMAYGDSVGGGMGACRMAHYPEFDLTVIIMARGEELQVESLSRDLARLLIEKPERTTLDLLLGPAELAPYLGNFQIGCSTVVIGSDAGRLTLDEIDQDPIVFLYQGEHRFIARDDSDVSVTFELRGELAMAFTLERHGMMTRAVRLMKKRAYDGRAEVSGG